MKKNQRKDSLRAWEEGFTAVLRRARNDTRQYLSSLPEDRSAFFATTISKKGFSGIYYPFAEKLVRHLGALEESACDLALLLEDSETQMDSEALTEGSRLFERFLSFRSDTNAFFQEVEALLKHSDDPLPLPPLRAAALRYENQTEGLLSLSNAR